MGLQMWLQEKQERHRTQKYCFSSHECASESDPGDPGKRWQNKDTSILDQFWPKKGQNIHAWLHLIVSGLMPFSFCENGVARSYMKPHPISRNTLMKYLAKLAATVEKKIAELLPEKFCLVFDGWSSSDKTGIFATFPSSTKGAKFLANPSCSAYVKVLLTFSPMGDEDSLNANEHYEFTSYILSLYEKDWSNVVCLVGDNCPTNKAFATKANARFIGCASHRFNLAVKDMLEEYEPLTTQVYFLMKKLKNIIPSAKLRKLTPLRPKCANVTRWSSTYEMLLRYTQLKEFLPSLHLDEVDDLLLTTRKDREIDQLLEMLTDLDSVTKALQEERLSVCDARALFDGVIGSFRQTAGRLSQHAEIIHDKVFESAIAKIQDGKAEDLNSEEQSAVSHLRVERHGKSTSEDNEAVPERFESLAERALKRRRVGSSVGGQSDYIDLSFIVPTSNICERLFSVVGYGLNSRWQSVLPSNFESQLFLHANKQLWGVSEVNKIMNVVGNDDDV